MMDKKTVNIRKILHSFTKEKKSLQIVDAIFCQKK